MRITLLTRVAAVAAVCGTLSLQAKQIDPKLTAELSGVPKAELAAQAAKMAVAADSEKATASIVEAALALSPEAYSTVVSSVSKAAPEMAPVAAVSAAKQQPKQLALIAMSAAAAAPEQAAKIVQALCKLQPKQYSTIANAVARVVEKMDQAILEAMVEGVPTLKPFYHRAVQMLSSEGEPVVARYTEQISRDVSGSAVALKVSGDTLLTAGLSSAQQELLPAPPAPPAPIVRPAFQPLPGTPGEINNSSTTVQTPPYTRNYSVP